MHTFVIYKHRTALKKDDIYCYNYAIAFIEKIEDWQKFCTLTNFNISETELVSTFQQLTTTADKHITLQIPYQPMVEYFPDKEKFVPFVLSEKGNLVLQLDDKELFVSTADFTENPHALQLTPVQKDSFYNILRGGRWFGSPSASIKDLKTAWENALQEIEQHKVIKQERRELHRQQENEKLLKNKAKIIKAKKKQGKEVRELEEKVNAMKAALRATAKKQPKEVIEEPPVNIEKTKRKRLIKPNQVIF